MQSSAFILGTRSFVLIKPTIGIPCATFLDKDWCPPILGHRQSYIDAIVQAGGVPLLIPLVVQEDVLHILYERIDGLLLAGGGDVAPHHYGEAPHPRLGTLEPLRDVVELPLTRWAAAEGKPILAICRGIQVLNVALGGTLYQDIPAQIDTDICHERSYELQDWTYMTHPVRLERDSRLAALLGTSELLTNSLHHQAIKDPAPDLRVVGRAPDGVIEAVEGTNGQFILGVQCHPEAVQDTFDPRWSAMFASFVAHCTAFRLCLTSANRASFWGTPGRSDCSE